MPHSPVSERSYPSLVSKPCDMRATPADRSGSRHKVSFGAFSKRLDRGNRNTDTFFTVPRSNDRSTTMRKGEDHERPSQNYDTAACHNFHFVPGPSAESEF